MPETAQTLAVSKFPASNSVVMLLAARLRHLTGVKWGTISFSALNGFAEKGCGALAMTA